jgi:hypothetical protein
MADKPGVNPAWLSLWSILSGRDRQPGLLDCHGGPHDPRRLPAVATGGIGSPGAAIVGENAGMSGQAAAAPRVLKRLQGLVRRPPDGVRTARTGRVPEDIATEAFRSLGLLPDEEEVYQEAQAILLSDLRFEHLERRQVADALWRFLCQCYADRTRDHVPQFIEEHARDVLDVPCYLPIEHLTVETDTDAAGLRLLPATSDVVPQQSGWFVLDPPVGCVAAVGVSGTNYARMAERARLTAEHRLRVLRIALREHPGILDQQLRFTLGEAYAFDDGLSGWTQRPQTAYGLTLAPSLVDLVRNQSVAALPLVPGNKLERKADLAVRWMERASLATEPLARLVYLFFALEALLGDTGEGLKAGVVAFRRAMLGEAVGRGFVHASGTYWLYDKVRSAAVHGSEPPAITDGDVGHFACDVREALADYLRYGKDHGFTRQSQLVDALDHHPDRPQLIAWLRGNGGDMWTKYLDKIDPAAATPSPDDPSLRESDTDE